MAIGAEGCTMGNIERQERPFDMSCPDMGKGLNYWKARCVKRQQDGICTRCKVGRAFLPTKPTPAKVKPDTTRPKDAAPVKRKAQKPKPAPVRRCGRPDCNGKHYAHDLCKVHHDLMKNDRRKAERWAAEPGRSVSYRLMFEAGDRDLLQAILAESQSAGRGFHETMLDILRRGVAE